MTFTDYVRTRRVGDNPAGDFTIDARRDRDLPNVKSWSELRSHLIRKGAGENVLKAARIVWNGYQSKSRNS